MPDEEVTQPPQRRIVPQPIEDEMQRSYIDYAVSVIVSRAIPDARDGLKPVQRRILHGMNELGMSSGGQYKKAARVVGEILGKYHPHGDIAIYDTIARMVQDFSLRYPLIDGQGNWGSSEDEPAAMRYTECRLAKTAEAMLEDIEKDTVEWMDNFDGTLKEPLVLPSKFPNLLVNGSSGIAVGMATNMPPHNLNEVIDALTVLIDHPAAELHDLFDPEKGPIRGPDFPTGGILYGMDGVTAAYREGRGLISIRARAEFEEAGHDKVRIVITEIPYMVNKAALVESIALLVKSKRIDGVTDLRDESDREGMRIVLELKRDAIEDVVLNQLYHHTQMETTFGVINLALVDGKPRYLSLKEELQVYIDHRVLMVRRRTEFDLRKARERLHIVEGLITAVDHLDEVIRLIRHSQTVDEARAGLMSRYLLSEAQANAILSMTLRQLTGLEIEKLRQEQRDLTVKIEDLEGILASRERILGIIKAELAELKEKFGDERRTSIELHAADMEIEDLIPEEDVVVTITNTGYIKRIPVTTYRTQKRGGKGVTGMETKEEDFVVNLFTASTHDYILFFTSRGQCHWLKTYRIPVGSRYAKGKPIVNLLERLEPNERILDMIAVREFDPLRTIVFATKLGRIKQTRLDAFQRPNVRGIRAIELNESDELVEARIADGDEQVILASAGGYANRFALSEVRSMGRTAAGVRGMRLRKDERVVSMALVKNEETELLTVLEAGLGKRTKVKEYRKTRRGSQGVQTTNVKMAKSPVVGVLEVAAGDEILVTTVGGVVIRCPVEDIRETGRAARGVRIQRLAEGDRVSAVVRLVTPQEEDAVGEATPPAPGPAE
ncbi:MAG TPA: DNA gyrase subunit A [Thermoplasmata archaeon]|nr:DNA gyrase subunit A [Thermoplasmata archaeon]